MNTIGFHFITSLMFLSEAALQVENLNTMLLLCNVISEGAIHGVRTTFASEDWPLRQHCHFIKGFCAALRSPWRNRAPLDTSIPVTAIGRHTVPSRLPGLKIKDGRCTERRTVIEVAGLYNLRSYMALMALIYVAPVVATGVPPELLSGRSGDARELHPGPRHSFCHNANSEKRQHAPGNMQQPYVVQFRPYSEAFLRVKEVFLIHRCSHSSRSDR